MQGLRPWPTLMSCFPPPPSKAFRLSAGLTRTAFYFGPSVGAWGGGCSWAVSWEQSRKARASGPSATCDVRSQQAAPGPRQGGEGGRLSGSSSALAQQLQHDLGERLLQRVPLLVPEPCCWLENLVASVS